MPFSITIRSYHPKDRPVLLNLLQLNIPKFFASSEHLDFEQYLDNELELYYVLFYEETLVGCGGINFEEKQTIGIISWDIIHPDFQGKSLGSSLLRYRLSELKSIRSIEKIIVRTSQLTYLFYEKQGFVLRENIPNYWAEGIDLCYMEYKHN